MSFLHFMYNFCPIFFIYDPCKSHRKFELIFFEMAIAHNWRKNSFEFRTVNQNGLGYHEEIFLNYTLLKMVWTHIIASFENVLANIILFIANDVHRPCVDNKTVSKYLAVNKKHISFYLSLFLYLKFFLSFHFVLFLLSSFFL